MQQGSSSCIREKTPQHRAAFALLQGTGLKAAQDTARGLKNGLGGFWNGLPENWE